MITDPRKLPPMIPVLILIYSNFSFLFNYVLLETLTSTLAMDQWAWKPESAVSILMVDILIMVFSTLYQVENMGFVTMGAAAMGVLVFAMIGPLAKRFDERLLLLVLGILPMLLGRAVMLPIPGVDHPPVNCFSEADWAPEFHADCDNITTMTSTTTTTTIAANYQRIHLQYNTSEGSRLSHQQTFINTFSVFIPEFIDAHSHDNHLVSKHSNSGCRYEWCPNIPRITVVQFMVGFVLGTIGYPFCLTLSASIFSKIIGAINPGLWLGLFATSGSVARVAGPLLVTEIYQEFGTYAMLIVVGITMVRTDWLPSYSNQFLFLPGRVWPCCW